MANECPNEIELAQALDGELTSNRCDEVRTHVAGCSRCERAIGALRMVTNRLATLPEEIGADRDPAFAAQVMARLDRGELPARRTPRWTFAAVGAAAAAVAILFVGSRPAERVETFAARGGELAWRDLTGVEVWIAPVAGEPARHRAEPAESFTSRAALSFRVTKGTSGRPLYLALFGVDAAGEVHWFHPAWTDPAEAPVSVALAHEPGTTSLADDVAPEGTATGPFRVHALFSQVPIAVTAIEAAVHTGRLIELASDVRLHTFELRFSGEP